MFSNAEHFNRHLHTAHKAHKDYKCEYCGKSYSLAHNLDRHIHTIHEESLKNFYNKPQFEKPLKTQHKRTNANFVMFSWKKSCFENTCAKGKRKKELDNRNKNIPCFLCKKVFKSSTEFTTHLCICRKNVIEDVPKSQKIQCTTIYPDGLEIRNEYKYTTTKFKCFICNNEFKTTFDLNQHMKMHYIKVVDVSSSVSMMEKPVAKLKPNSDHNIDDPLNIESASHLLLAGSQLSRNTDNNSEMEIKSEAKNMPTLMSENLT